MGDWLSSTLLIWLASLSAAAPLAGFALLRAKPRRPWKALAGAALIFLAALLAARSELAFAILPSPWQGMIFESALALAVILATRKPAADGLTLRIPRRAWRDALIATALLAGFVALRAILLTLLGRADSGGTIGLEYLLYTLSMPGIAEELTYRGVIQSRLNRALPQPWMVAGAPIGLGFVITAVWFWAIHAFTVSPPAALNFYWPTLTLQLIVGLGLGWMRERTGSVIPGIIAHNLINLVRVIV